MKKIVCILLVLAICLPMCACGTTDTNTTAGVNKATFAAESTPREIALTVDNVTDYFTIIDSGTTKEWRDKEHNLYYKYHSALNGELSVVPCVTLKSMKNVTMTVRATFTVEYYLGTHSHDGVKYLTREREMDIIVSAATGSGSGTYTVEFEYFHKYPSITFTSAEVIAVTGTVAPA